MTGKKSTLQSSVRKQTTPSHSISFLSYKYCKTNTFIFPSPLQAPRKRVSTWLAWATAQTAWTAAWVAAVHWHRNNCRCSNRTRRNLREAIPHCTSAGIVAPPLVWAIISSQQSISCPAICCVNSRTVQAGRSSGWSSLRSVCISTRVIRMSLHWPVYRCWAIRWVHPVIRIPFKRSLSLSYPSRTTCISLEQKALTPTTGKSFLRMIKRRSNVNSIHFQVAWGTAQHHPNPGLQKRAHTCIWQLVTTANKILVQFHGSSNQCSWNPHRNTL